MSQSNNSQSLTSSQKIEVYSTINNLVENFLDESFDEKIDNERIIQLSHNGIKITIDISNYKPE